MGRRALAAIVSLVVVAGCAPAARAEPCDGEHWVATWVASPSDAGRSRPLVARQTLRMIVTPHFGGRTLRLRLTNRYRSRSARIAAVTVARQAAGAALEPGTARAVTFGGARDVAIPGGADVYSDPVELPVEPFENLAVSVYVDEAVANPTEHFTTRQTSYASAPGTGDLTGDERGAAFGSTRTAYSNGWYFLAGVDVRAPRGAGTLVAFGDSITDGFQGFELPILEGFDGVDESVRYPDLLQRRLLATGVALTVANAGISGNRVLSDADYPFPFADRALDRFEADALDVAGVTDVLILQGINDIGNGASAEALIAGLAELVARAKARGLNVLLGTLTPAGGTRDAGYGGRDADARRRAVNEWIRTRSGADAVVDFDAATRDPADPSRLRAEHDSSDHLHPSTAGYRAMADAVDLGALRGPDCDAARGASVSRRVVTVRVPARYRRAFQRARAYVSGRPVAVLTPRRPRTTVAMPAGEAVVSVRYVVRLRDGRLVRLTRRARVRAAG